LGQTLVCRILGRRLTGRASVNLLMLIYFVSGACSLIDEVVWVRLLKLTLGNTVYASSIVVSTFMGGLAIGALIMGRYCDGIKRRLGLYALLEGLAAVSALLLPWGLRLTDGIYVWFYRTYHPTDAQLLVVQAMISGVIVLVPSILMGSTLPLLARFVTAIEREAGHLVGRLYALNTLGAAVGCFLAGFVLIRALGVMGTLYTAALLNLLVAVAGGLLSRFSRRRAEEQAETAGPPSSQLAPTQTADGKFLLLVAAFFSSGLISIGYELLWMRSIIHLLGGSTYVFSAVLSVYLLGNVIGAGLGSALVKTLKTPALGFAVSLFVLGLCGIFYLPQLILWTSDVLPEVKRNLEWLNTLIPFSMSMMTPLAQSASLFLIPTVIMGVGFPMALQAWAEHVHKVGRSTGTAYAANTIGAVVGGIVTGFVLIPLLGLQAAVSILGLAGVWIAAVMYISFAGKSKVVVRFGVPGAAVVVLTALVVSMPSDLFSTVVRSNPDVQRELKLVAVEEGVTTTVSLYRDSEEGTLYLFTSGTRVAGDTYFWRSDQKMLGHFGILLNSGARKILSVGFGSGESTACIALHKPERADCVEIAREMVDVSLRYFRHINLGDRLSEHVNMIYMDAKNYIHLTDVRYDAIVSDVTHPRRFAENASLYAKEYFESAKEHLAEDGLFMTWIPTHNVETESVLNSIIGTIMEVFPHVTIWYMTPNPTCYFLVVGSKQPQYFSPRHIENELLKEGVRESLSLIDINNSMDLMSCYIGDADDLRRWVRSYRLNSDYYPFIEFCPDERAGGSAMFQRFVFDIRSESVYKHIDWSGLSEEDKSKWLSEYKRLWDASTYLLLSNGTDSNLEKLRYSMQGLAVLPGNAALRSVRRRAVKAFLWPCTEIIRRGGADSALQMAECVLEVYPRSSFAWMVKSSAMEQKGDMRGALEAAKTAVHVEPEDAEAHMHLASILCGAGQSEDAIAECQEAVRLAEHARGLTDYHRVRMLNALEAAYAAAGRLPEAAATAEKALELASSTEQREMAEQIKKRLVLLKGAGTAGQQH